MDNNIKPKVSVTICTYNRANLIKQAIDSIFRQKYGNIEIIIVDDASTDNTEETVKDISGKYPIKYCKNPRNLGIAGTRNETVKIADGKYIAILDSDDYWTDENKIEKQVNFLEANEKFALVGTNAIKVDVNNVVLGKIENLTEAADIKRNLLVRNEFVHSTVLYRKEIIIEFGCFNIKTSPFEDYDLILKIAKKYSVGNLADYSTAYRVHSGGESKKLNLSKKIKFISILLKNSFSYPQAIKAISRRLSN